MGENIWDLRKGKLKQMYAKNKCIFILCMLMLQFWKDSVILALLLRINFQKPHNYACIKEHFFLLTLTHIWWRTNCFCVKLMKLKFWLKYMFSGLPNKKITCSANSLCICVRECQRCSNSSKSRKFKFRIVNIHHA